MPLGGYLEYGAYPLITSGSAVLLTQTTSLFSERTSETNGPEANVIEDI